MTPFQEAVRGKGSVTRVGSPNERNAMMYSDSERPFRERAYKTQEP